MVTEARRLAVRAISPPELSNDHAVCSAPRMFFDLLSSARSETTSPPRVLPRRSIPTDFTIACRGPRSDRRHSRTAVSVAVRVVLSLELGRALGGSLRVVLRERSVAEAPPLATACATKGRRASLPKATDGLSWRKSPKSHANSIACGHCDVDGKKRRFYIAVPPNEPGIPAGRSYRTPHSSDRPTQPAYVDTSAGPDAFSGARRVPGEYPESRRA